MPAARNLAYLFAFLCIACGGGGGSSSGGGDGSPPGGGDAAVDGGAEPVARVDVQPSPASVLVGATVQLTATPADAAGSPLAGRVIHWRSADPAIATVDETGLVTGVAAGTTTIAAESDGVSGQAQVVVSAAASFAVDQLETNGQYACAIAGGSTWCWGDNPTGQLGTGDTMARDRPVAVQGGPFTAVATGGSQTCGLTADGTAWCWGDDSSLQLGAGVDLPGIERVPVLRPQQVATSVRFRSLATTRTFTSTLDHTCGLDMDGAAWCWGANDTGQLGIENFHAFEAAPVAVSGGLRFTQLDVGASHTCGIATDGVTYCWGQNDIGFDRGELGDGGTMDRSNPLPVAGDLRFTAISTGARHTCALTAEGAAYCWGANTQGELGDGTTDSRLVPTPVAGGLTFRSISAGESYTCAVTPDGQGYCWGNNGAGNLGVGDSEDRHDPTPVVGGHTFAKIDAGSLLTCGIDDAGMAYCWGAGPIGNGTQDWLREPTPVAAP